LNCNETRTLPVDNGMLAQSTFYHIDMKGADHMAAANMWDFPVMEGISFENANHVHPLMQGRVEKLLRGIFGDPNIRRAILFGSSL